MLFLEVGRSYIQSFVESHRHNTSYLVAWASNCLSCIGFLALMDQLKVVLKKVIDLYQCLTWLWTWTHILICFHFWGWLCFLHDGHAFHYEGATPCSFRVSWISLLDEPANILMFRGRTSQDARFSYTCIIASGWCHMHFALMSDNRPFSRQGSDIHIYFLKVLYVLVTPMAIVKYLTWGLDVKWRLWVA